MRKLILISISFLLLFACKKEALKPEVHFLTGKWQLDKRIEFSKVSYEYQTTGPIYKAVQDSSFLEMEFKEKGFLIYTLNGKSKKFRIVKQTIEPATGYKKSIFIPSLNQYILNLDLKDSKNQSFDFKVNYNQGVETVIMADYFVPDMKTYDTKYVDFDDSYTNYYTFKEFQNPRHGKFKKL